MSKFRITSLVVCSAVLLSACSYRSEYPTVTKSESVKVPVIVETTEAQTAPVKVAKPQPTIIDMLDKVAVQEPSADFYNGAPTISGKVAGDYGSGSLIRIKIKGISKDYDRLMNDVSEIESNIKQTNLKTSSITSDYVSLLAGMTVRLQAGTTPGNPRLVSQWNQSQQSLESLSKELLELQVLANDIDNDASLASFLINAIQATYGISGAVEEEHEELKRIEDELSYLINRIGRLVTSVNDDITRQTSYLEEERKNMQTLALAVKKGEFFGNSVMNRTMQAVDNFEAQQAAFEMKRSAISSRYPIITIRFADDNVDYAKMLYKAVDGAVDLKPNATFRIVAISPETVSVATTETAQEYAKVKGEQVFRDMVKMGVPAKNIELANAVSRDVEVTEVQLFLK